MLMRRNGRWIYIFIKYWVGTAHKTIVNDDFIQSNRQSPVFRRLFCITVANLGGYAGWRELGSWSIKRSIPTTSLFLVISLCPAHPNLGRKVRDFKRRLLTMCRNINKFDPARVSYQGRPSPAKQMWNWSPGGPGHQKHRLCSPEIFRKIFRHWHSV